MANVKDQMTQGRCRRGAIEQMNHDNRKRNDVKYLSETDENGAGVTSSRRSQSVGKSEWNHVYEKNS